MNLLSVFRAFQRAFYVDGLDTTDGKVLAEVGAAALRSAGFDTDAEAFFSRSSSDEVIQATRADFALTRNLGVAGFPTLLVEWDGKMARIGSGFMPAAQPKQTLARLAD
ncbi:DsbA family protein [Paraburkholderia sp. DGU8]|uniref:DsbA family protein n=1 Tax=Paraburkholderia sp. DGU8 TaxID=3161997 RepID=UPI003465307C